MIIDPSTHDFSATSGFFVLEGVNGAGKSTLHARLVESLSAAGHEVIKTFEPGATRLGKTLRKILLESPDEKPSTRAELLPFAADRAEHVETVIRPALARNAIVISDRYFYSTVTFQGNGRGLDRRLIDAANDAAIQGLLPDAVLLLDLDPAEGLRRAAARAGAPIADSFEKESLAFHERIRSGFLNLAETRPEPFAVPDARRSPDELFATALAVMQRAISARRSGAAR